MRAWRASSRSVERCAAFSLAQVRRSCLKLCRLEASSNCFSFSGVVAAASSLSLGPDSSPSRTAFARPGNSGSFSDALRVPAGSI